MYFLAEYVDDCILVGKSSPFIAKFKNDFSKRFKIEDLGPVACYLTATLLVIERLVRSALDSDSNVLIC